jgi:hypothetical protein
MPARLSGVPGKTSWEVSLNQCAMWEQRWARISRSTIENGGIERECPRMQADGE